ncbi:MAG: family 20 glycosylhydrolase [Actinobacteria bacterium]|nr:family 20 glycosylhydrolase [Actinomycetota bacterium]
MPAPQQVEWGNGWFLFPSDSMGIATKINNPNDFETGLQELIDAFQKNAGCRLRKADVAKADIIFGLSSRDADFTQLCHKNGLLPDEKPGDEGYRLLIGKKKIIAAANTSTGLFYAAQTLIQLLRGHAGENRLPCLKITDRPDFKFRGMQDDISRGPVPTMDFFKKQIRRCAELKLNMISYYTENVVATQKHGDFAPTGGAVTIDQWKELADYADKYHIQLLPNFQSFGHFEKILAYPQYAPLGEAGRMLSPTKEASYRLLADIYREMAPAFSSPFFNVNCDETWDLGRGASKKLMDSLGTAGVYARHINRLSRLLKKHGKRMMMWADVALAHPQILKMIPKETILITWEYGDQGSFTNIIAPLKKAGFTVMICPGVLNSNRLMPDFRKTRGNIRKFIRDGKSEGVMGVLTAVWDDGGSALFSRDWYGVAFAAEQSWNTDSLAAVTFDLRFDRAVYGDASQSIARVINRLEPLTDLAPTQEMNEKIFWSTLIPKRGESISLNLRPWQQVAGICEQAGKIIEQAGPNTNVTDIDYLKLSIDQYDDMAKSRMAVLAAADFYRQACLLQKTDRRTSRGLLVEALQKLQDTRLRLDHIKATFRHLWLLENRIYWLDHNLDMFSQKETALGQAIQYLSAALRDFELGHYLPPPNQVRLDVRKIEGDYFQSWLICGAFKNTGKNIDYLTSMGGEANARPTVWDAVEWPQGSRKRWRKVTSKTFAKVNLADLFTENTHVVAYAYCRIESDRERDVTATFGSNDGIEIFLNGEKSFQHHVKRNLVPDEERLVLHLKKGNNYLLLKIDQGKGGWGFSFRLRGVQVRNHDYKYRIINS